MCTYHLYVNRFIKQGQKDLFLDVLSSILRLYNMMSWERSLWQQHRHFLINLSTQVKCVAGNWLFFAGITFKITQVDTIRMAGYCNQVCVVFVIWVTITKNDKTVMQSSQKITIKIIMVWHLMGSLPNILVNSHLKNKIWRPAHICSTTIPHYNAV